MKNQFVLLLLCICFTTSAQVKNYYPPAGNWERKTPISLSVDSNLINEAIQYALNQMQEHDILLIAGKGHEEYQIYGTQKNFFSDVKTVESFLTQNNK